MAITATTPPTTATTVLELDPVLLSSCVWTSINAINQNIKNTYLIIQHVLVINYRTVVAIRHVPDIPAELTVCTDILY